MKNRSGNKRGVDKQKKQNKNKSFKYQTPDFAAFKHSQNKNQAVKTALNHI